MVDVNKSEELWIIFCVLSDKGKYLLSSLLCYQLNILPVMLPASGAALVPVALVLSVSIDRTNNLS